MLWGIQGDPRQETQTQFPDLCSWGQRITENIILLPLAIVSFISSSLTAGSSRSVTRGHKRRNRFVTVGVAVFSKRWDLGLLHWLFCSVWWVVDRCQSGTAPGNNLWHLIVHYHLRGISSPVIQLTILTKACKVSEYLPHFTDEKNWSPRANALDFLANGMAECVPGFMFSDWQTQCSLFLSTMELVRWPFPWAFRLHPLSGTLVILMPSPQTRT